MVETNIINLEFLMRSECRGREQWRPGGLQQHRCHAAHKCRPAGVIHGLHSSKFEYMLKKFRRLEVMISL